MNKRLKCECCGRYPMKVICIRDFNKLRQDLYDTKQHNVLLEEDNAKMKVALEDFYRWYEGKR